VPGRTCRRAPVAARRAGRERSRVPGDLFRHEADEEDDHREHDEQHGAVRDLRSDDEVQPRMPSPSTKAARLSGRNTRSGLKSVTTRRMIRRNFTPSRASRIFDLPDALPGLDRLERDVVARLDEGQRGRGRRREPVRQQVDELAQHLAARAAEAGRQVGDRAAGEVAGEPVEQPRCRTGARTGACVAPRARRRRGRTRRAGRRGAARPPGPCWPSPSMISTYSPVACGCRS
jgi:hypothetical protein